MFFLEINIIIIIIIIIIKKRELIDLDESHI